MNFRPVDASVFEKLRPEHVQVTLHSSLEHTKLIEALKGQPFFTNGPKMFFEVSLENQPALESIKKHWTDDGMYVGLLYHQSPGFSAQVFSSDGSVLPSYGKGQTVRWIKKELFVCSEANGRSLVAGWRLMFHGAGLVCLNLALASVDTSTGTTMPRLIQAITGRQPNA